MYPILLLGLKVDRHLWNHSFLQDIRVALLFGQGGPELRLFISLSKNLGCSYGEFVQWSVGQWLNMDTDKFPGSWDSRYPSLGISIRPMLHYLVGGSHGASHGNFMVFADCTLVFSRHPVLIMNLRCPTLLTTNLGYLPLTSSLILLVTGRSTRDDRSGCVSLGFFQAFMRIVFRP